MIDHNVFHTIPTPYTTTDSDGDTVTVHHILDDGRLLCTIKATFGDDYAYLFRADGTAPGSFASHHLNPPPLPGRAEYENLADHRKNVILDLIRCRQTIYCVKYLRGELGLGLGDAKRLYDRLADECRA